MIVNGSWGLDQQYLWVGEYHCLTFPRLWLITSVLGNMMVLGVSFPPPWAVFSGVSLPMLFIYFLKKPKELELALEA